MRLIDADAIMRSIDINWGCDECKAQCVDNCLIHQLKEIVMTAPTIPQWIPVSERLPQDDDNVLVSTKLHDVFECYIDGKGIWRIDDEDGAYVKNEIIAWMPLPEPYKESDNE